MPLYGDLQLYIYIYTLLRTTLYCDIGHGVHSTLQLVCYAHQNPVTPHKGVHSTPKFCWCDTHHMV